MFSLIIKLFKFVLCWLAIEALFNDQKNLYLNSVDEDLVLAHVLAVGEIGRRWILGDGVEQNFDRRELSSIGNELKLHEFILVPPSNFKSTITSFLSIVECFKHRFWTHYNTIFMMMISYQLFWFVVEGLVICKQYYSEWLCPATIATICFLLIRVRFMYWIMVKLPDTSYFKLNNMPLDQL